MKQNQVLIFAFFMLISFSFLSSSTRPEVKLRDMQRAVGANYTIITDSDGRQAYSLLNTNSFDVKLNPVGYVPSATGNSLDTNAVVVDPNSDTWIIDSEGDALKLNSVQASNTDTTIVINNNGGSDTSAVFTASSNFEIKINYSGTEITTIGFSAGVYTISIPSGCQLKNFAAKWSDEDVSGSNGIDIRFLDADDRMLWFSSQLFFATTGIQLVGNALASVTPRQSFSGGNLTTQSYSSVNDDFRLLGQFSY